MVSELPMFNLEWCLEGAVVTDVGLEMSLVLTCSVVQLHKTKIRSNGMILFMGMSLFYLK